MNLYELSTSISKEERKCCNLFMLYIKLYVIKYVGYVMDLDKGSSTGKGEYFD